MAGTIVSDTLQDGAGNSTATTNALKGSAKAWAMINGGAGTVTAGFNVSSVTRNSTGNYTINYTTAMSSSTYATLATCTGVSSFSQGCVAILWSGGITTTSANIQALQQNTSGVVDTTLYFAAFSS
jgi:endoglucanase Acf2